MNSPESAPPDPDPDRDRYYEALFYSRKALCALASVDCLAGVKRRNPTAASEIRKTVAALAALLK